jgi:hypothetical protein
VAIASIVDSMGEGAIGGKTEMVTVKVSFGRESRKAA